MTGRQHKEFNWIRLIRLEIPNEKINRPCKLLGLGGSSPPFARFSPPGFHVV